MKKRRLAQMRSAAYRHAANPLLSAVAVILIAATPSTHAWDGTVSGKIAAINGVGSASGAPGNYDIRVYIEGQPTICAGATDPGWGYINTSDANYKGLLAMLLMAQVSGKTVTLYTLKGPAGEPPNPDPVRFGSSNIASFSPLGSCTAGTLFLRSTGGAQFAVRIAGVTGRSRVLRYESLKSGWKDE